MTSEGRGGGQGEGREELRMGGGPFDMEGLISDQLGGRGGGEGVTPPLPGPRLDSSVPQLP